MSQQTKNAIDIVIKSFAVIALGVIGFFAQRFAIRAEEARDSMIRLEVQFNDHKEYSNQNDSYIKMKLQQLETEIRGLK